LYVQTRFAFKGLHSSSTLVTPICLLPRVVAATPAAGGSRTDVEVATGEANDGLSAN